jgi:hypothetical protein
MEVALCQRLIDTGLVSAKGTAALKQQNDRIEFWPSSLPLRPAQPM